MQTFEHEIIILPGEDEKNKKRLDELSEQGWELVSVASVCFNPRQPHFGLKAFLRRPKQ